MKAEPAIVQLEEQIASRLDIPKIRIVTAERSAGIIKIGLPGAGLAALVCIGALLYALIR